MHKKKLTLSVSLTEPCQHFTTHHHPLIHLQLSSKQIHTQPSTPNPKTKRISPLTNIHTIEKMHKSNAKRKCQTTNFIITQARLSTFTTCHRPTLNHRLPEQQWQILLRFQRQKGKFVFSESWWGAGCFFLPPLPFVKKRPLHTLQLPTQIELLNQH